MTPHHDNNRGTFVIDRQFPGVGRVKRASGTTDAGVYKSLDTMLTTLWNMGRVDLLRAIQDGKLHIMEVWASFRLGRLNELPDPDSLKPLGAAWGDWIETTDHSSRYKGDMRGALNRLSPKPTDTVIKLPALLMGYRFKCHRKGHGTTFRHTKAICQSFVRDTLGRSHPIYDRLRDIQTLKVHRKEGNPQEPDQARAIRDALGEHGHTWWTMCCTGMMPDELWGGKWKVRSNHVHILGTKTQAKTAARNRKVPRICTPTAPTPTSASGFAKALLKASGGAVTPYDGRRTFIHWVEEAGISRTRRKMYAGHSAKDVTDLYERHELAAYLDTDAALLRAYLAPDQPHLEVMKA